MAGIVFGETPYKETQYRELTLDEVKAIIDKYAETDKIKQAKDIIRKHYPKSAYKVFIKANSDYDDNYYNAEPVVIVLDRDMNELESSIGFYEIKMLLYPDDSSADEYEDYTFTIQTEEDYPRLYIRMDYEF